MDEITPKNDETHDSSGIFENLTVRIKLIIRLMMDSRVNPLIKLLPVATLLYFLIPDVIIGPIDDVVIVWLGTVLFVELCPDEIVKEHMDALTSTVEGTFHEVDDQDLLDAPEE
jgi:uncharacterized membrane protein YkvA (DUF1232 family)